MLISQICPKFACVKKIRFSKQKNNKKSSFITDGDAGVSSNESLLLSNNFWCVFLRQYSLLTKVGPLVWDRCPKSRQILTGKKKSNISNYPKICGWIPVCTTSGAFTIFQRKKNEHFWESFQSGMSAEGLLRVASPRADTKFPVQPESSQYVENNITYGGYTSLQLLFGGLRINNGYKDSAGGTRDS